jgi:hypothetical protein
MLAELVGEEAAKVIGEHPNLFVVSVPVHMADDLKQGSVMIVPIGTLCPDCDAPRLEYVCTCTIDTILIEDAYGRQRTVLAPKSVIDEEELTEEPDGAALSTPAE